MCKIREGSIFYYLVFCCHSQPPSLQHTMVGSTVPHNGWSNIYYILRQRWERLEVLDGIGQLHLWVIGTHALPISNHFSLRKMSKVRHKVNMMGLSYNYNLKALPVYCDGLFRWSITLIFLSIQNKKNASSILSWAESRYYKLFPQFKFYFTFYSSYKFP